MRTMAQFLLGNDTSSKYAAEIGCLSRAFKHKHAIKHISPHSKSQYQGINFHKRVNEVQIIAIINILPLSLQIRVCEV